MVLQDGFPSASGLASANDVRLGLAGLILRDSSGNPRTGVLARHPNALVTSTPTLNSSVAAAEFVVSRASSQGVILLANDGATNVLHTAPPVANSRYDIVYVKQFDSVAPNADASNVPAFGVFAGPASAGPTAYTYATAKAALAAAPGIGAGAEPLAMVLIPSTATTMQSGGVVYTMLNQYTCATGGTFPVRTASDLTALTGYAIDQRALANDTGIIHRWNGTAWKPWESDWITYTATLTGFAVGTGGSALARTRYRYDGGMAEVDWKFVFGTTGATLPATPKFQLPFAAVVNHDYTMLPSAGDLFDTSGTRPIESGLITDAASATTVRIWYRRLASDGFDYPVSASTLPWVFGAGDSMSGRATFEPA